jgi:hypothetical protein
MRVLTDLTMLAMLMISVTLGPSLVWMLVWMAWR